MTLANVELPCTKRCCYSCGRTLTECIKDRIDGSGLGRCCPPCNYEGPLHPKKGEVCEHQ